MLYAVLMSAAACTAAALLMSSPPSTPGGNPVMDVPGDKPIRALMTVKPVFVIVEAANTP